MASCQPLLVIFISIIYSTNSEVINCSGDCSCPSVPPTPGETCILNCDNIDICKASTLNCRAGDACIINCTEHTSCSDRTQINGDTATHVSVICDGTDACKARMNIKCGSGDCKLQCDQSTACMDFGSIDLSSNPKSFQCTGYCPPTGSGSGEIPIPFSLSPTASPITYPTLHPTTYTPSNIPTIIPTMYPTANPFTYSPTLIPTVYPTVNPTTYTPSNIPTIIPTVYPTANLFTYLPTLPYITTSIPSPIPTVYPTVNPTTYKPTTIPTITPTVTPMTYSPTKYPILHSTVEVTSEPTIEPTNEPTVLLTYNPTMEPSIYPSTNYPTIILTHFPTTEPSISTQSLTLIPIYEFSTSMISTGVDTISGDNHIEDNMKHDMLSISSKNIMILLIIAIIIITSAFFCCLGIFLYFKRKQKDVINRILSTHHEINMSHIDVDNDPGQLQINHNLSTNIISRSVTAPESFSPQSNYYNDQSINNIQLTAICTVSTGEILNNKLPEQEYGSSIVNICDETENSGDSSTDSNNEDMYEVNTITAGDSFGFDCANAPAVGENHQLRDHLKNGYNSNAHYAISYNSSITDVTLPTIPENNYLNSYKNVQ
eukprot:242710_1